jgi:hypothetical protein
MATQILTRNAATFAAGAWSGAGFTDGDDMLIPDPISQITAGLVPGGLTAGPASVVFGPGCSGVVGGGSYGPFTLPMTATNAYLANLSNRVALFLAAGTGGIENVSTVGGELNLQGGTFGTVTLLGGNNYVTDSTVIDTEIDVAGGTNVIEYNANAIPAANFSSGHQTTVRRVLTAATLTSGILNIDYDDVLTTPTSAITLTGGICRILNGRPSTIHVRDGVLDFRLLKKTTNFTGVAVKVWGRGEVHRSNLATNLTVTYVGAQTFVGRDSMEAL